MTKYFVPLDSSLFIFLLLSFSFLLVCILFKIETKLERQKAATAFIEFLILCYCFNLLYAKLSFTFAFGIALLLVLSITFFLKNNFFEILIFTLFYTAAYFLVGYTIIVGLLENVLIPPFLIVIGVVTLQNMESFGFTKKLVHSK